MDTKTFLDSIYDLAPDESLRGVYDKWAASYEAELAQSGYLTPQRAALALAPHVKDKTTPILDLGCGTGLFGHELHKHGFTTIDGVDFSPKMLAAAHEKSIYRNLFQADLTSPFSFETGAYGIMSAIDAILPNHVLPETIDHCLEHLPSKGLFCFSLNEQALQHHEYEGRIMENLDTGYAHLIFKKDGPHIKALNMNATIYILEKR